MVQSFMKRKNTCITLHTNLLSRGPTNREITQKPQTIGMKEKTRSFMTYGKNVHFVFRLNLRKQNAKFERK